MGPFIGIIVYCAIAYYVVPRAYEIETAKGPEADLKRLEVRGPYLGKGGATLKKIGIRSREKIEGLAGGQVFLQLTAKVRPNWRKREADLKRFGYRS